MEIEALDKKGYRLLRIKEDLSHETDLAQLKTLIQSHLDEEVKNLALSFTKDSFFYSRTIAILVQFMGYVKEREGNFAIIHPNISMLEMIKLIGLDKLMEMHTSEDSIGK
jgi:anti-anti-sigma factor